MHGEGDSIRLPRSRVAPREGRRGRSLQGHASPRGGAPGVRPLHSGKPITPATEQFFLTLLTPDPERVRDVQWIRAERLLALHGLGPLAMAVDRGLHGNFLPRSVAARLEPAYLATRERVVRLLEADQAIGEALWGADLPFLRIGGSALVREGVYMDPGARPIDELQFVVPFGAAEEAVRTFLAVGFTPTVDWHPSLLEARRSLCFRFDAAAEGDSPMRVELIWRTESLHLGRCDTPEDCPLWAGADVEAGLPAPGPHLHILAERLLSGVGTRGYLRGLADIGRLIPRVESWERFMAVASPRPFAPGVGLVLRALEEETGAPVPRGVIRSLGGGRLSLGPAARWIRPAHVLRAATPSSTRPGDLFRQGVLLGSPLQAARAAAAALWPREPWLRAEFGDEDAPVPALRSRYLSTLLRGLLSPLGIGKSEASGSRRTAIPT
ncbi:MAG: nucleotidyltransferase family protein [Gemmatimonadota bacterium]